MRFLLVALLLTGCGAITPSQDELVQSVDPASPAPDAGVSDGALEAAPEVALEAPEAAPEVAPEATTPAGADAGGAQEFGQDAGVAPEAAAAEVAVDSVPDVILMPEAASDPPCDLCDQAVRCFAALNFPPYPNTCESLRGAARSAAVAGCRSDLAEVWNGGNRSAECPAP